MGWLRRVGCLKTYVSLQNIGLFCRSLLQKRPIFLSILLIVATPYKESTSVFLSTFLISIWIWMGHVWIWIWMSPVAHINEPCLTYKCVAHIHESCRTYEDIPIYIPCMDIAVDASCLLHNFIIQTWLSHMRDMEKKKTSTSISMTHATWRIHIQMMRHVADMGWLQLVGFLKS